MKNQIAFLTVAFLLSSFSKYETTAAPFLQIRLKSPHLGMLVADGNEAKNDSGNTEPWTPRQLMAPSDLAAIINNPQEKKPVIICVGPGALIKGSLDMGPASEKQNLEKLKQELNKLSRDTDIVIYCGCCPFEHCPNIRPAFILLNEMKFSRARLLNLEHNIKTDWVAKGYPQA